MGDFISLALADPAKKFSPEEKALLEEILSTLPEELAGPTLFTFDSESAHPGFFQLDGAVRVAKTGSSVGDTIFINRDLIYTLRDGQWAAMTILECVPLLIHELGHHHGNHSHEFLDLLGVKVQALLGHNIITDRFDPTLTVIGDDISGLKSFPVLTAIELSNNTKVKFDTRLYISDSETTYDITESLLNGIKNIGDKEGAGANKLAGKSCWGSTFETSENKGYKLSQVHLAAPRWTYTTTVIPGLYLFAIKAAASAECVSTTGERVIDPGLDLLQLVLVQATGSEIKLKFINEPALMNQMTLINDDDDYKVFSVLRPVFAALFQGRRL